MKACYEAVEMEIVEFEQVDVISTSAEATTTWSRPMDSEGDDYYPVWP